MTDQELADRVHAAVHELNSARDVAVAAGLDVSIASFTAGTPFVAHVVRRIPAVVTKYEPTAPHMPSTSSR